MSYWYIASPYSKFPGGLDAAFRAACEQAALLVKAGIHVFSPICHSHPISVWGDIPAESHEIWMPLDLAFVDGAQGLIVCKLPSWRNSYGVSLEIEAFAKACKPILFMDPGVVPDVTACR